MKNQDSPNKTEGKASQLSHVTNENNSKLYQHEELSHTPEKNSAQQLL